jgi:hypothetical protein
MVQELDLFPSSGKGRETTTLLGPLERANPNHWTTHVKFTDWQPASQYVLMSSRFWFSWPDVCYCLIFTVVSLWGHPLWREDLKFNTVFWDVTPCGFIINLRFGRMCRLHLQVTKNNPRVPIKETLDLFGRLLRRRHLETLPPCSDQLRLKQWCGHGTCI